MTATPGAGGEALQRHLRTLQQEGDEVGALNARLSAALGTIHRKKAHERASLSSAPGSEEIAELRRCAEAKDVLLADAWEQQRRCEDLLAEARGENDALRTRVQALESELAARDAELLSSALARTPVAALQETMVPTATSAAADIEADEAREVLARWGLSEPAVSSPAGGRYNGSQSQAHTSSKQQQQHPLLQRASGAKSASLTAVAIVEAQDGPACAEPAEVAIQGGNSDDEVAAAAAAAVAELVREKAAHGLSAMAGIGGCSDGDVDAFVARVQEQITGAHGGRQQAQAPPQATSDALASLASLGARMLPMDGADAGDGHGATMRFSATEAMDKGSEALEPLSQLDRELDDARDAVSNAVRALQ